MQRILLLSLAWYLLDSNVFAFDCKRLLVGVAVSATMTSGTAADLVPSRFEGPRQDRRLRWPFETTTYITSVPMTADTLGAAVDLAQTRYENLFFYEGVGAVYDPKEYPADRWWPSHLGARWVNVDGGWNSVTIPAPESMPFEYAFGTQVVYDPTPHTPGLYQFTEIDWSQYPFRVTITHRAWIILEPLSNDWRRNQVYEELSAIPNPGTLAILGLSGLALVKRHRVRAPIGRE